MKQFILGLAVGAVTVAAADRLLGSERLPSRNDPPQIASSMDISVGPLEERPLAVPPGSPEEPPEPAIALSVESPEDALEQSEFDALEDARCIERSTSKHQRKEAALQAEPKDPQWSYATEGLLQQFIVSHRLAPRFELTSVDCRTTYCEVKASARDDRASMAFETAQLDALKEPWNEFTSATSGGSSRDGAVMRMHFRVTRRQ